VIGASELTVIIPTRDRWPILARTLRALESQTVGGFHTTVVVDGSDQLPPLLPGWVRVLVKEASGPGSSRNAGVRDSDTRLVLFLGDDMVPTPGLVASHLARHARHSDPEVAVLGHVEWHPEVGDSPLLRWLDRSASQFDYASITGEDAGWGRFYSCNVSLDRDFFLSSGGFDPEFTFDYEDLDLAWRLHMKGLRLMYEPGAVALHLHRYDWAGLERRYRSRGMAERLMVQKHDWFEPFFGRRLQGAASQRPVSVVWPVAAELMAGRGGALSRQAEKHADRWYHRRLVGHYLAGWEGQRDLEELRAYLGDAFDPQRLSGHRSLVDEEEAAASSESHFYRTSESYLYDLTVFSMSGTKAPYVLDLRRHVPCGATLVDYGCGIGADGLRLLELGYKVAFADFNNPSTAFLRWRLQHRGLRAEVYDLDEEVPGGFDGAYAFDVIEHVQDPFEFLSQLESRATVVAVNFLEPEPGDTHLHKPLPIPELLDHAAEQGILRYRIYHQRSHLVVYRGSRPAARVGRTRGAIERRWGPGLAELSRRLRV